MFFPTKIRKTSKKEEIGVARELLLKVDKAFENDPTEKLMKFFEQENERTRQHDLRLFTMLLGQQNQVGATATELQNKRKVPAHAKTWEDIGLLCSVSLQCNHISTR